MMQSIVVSIIVVFFIKFEIKELITRTMALKSLLFKRSHSNV